LGLPDVIPTVEAVRYLVERLGRGAGDQDPYLAVGSFAHESVEIVNSLRVRGETANRKGCASVLTPTPEDG
jgi:hypothetical protein